MGLIKGSKTIFRIGDTIVANRVSISGYNVTMGEWDATDLDSNNMVGAPTLPDPGEMSLTFNHDLGQSAHVAMLTDIGVEKFMSIEYVSGETNKFLNFKAWIKNPAMGEANPTNYVKSSVTVRLVTLPTWGNTAVTGA